MTLTGRIRLYLTVAAVIPPLVIMAVIYLHSVKKAEESGKLRAYENLRKFQSFNVALQNEILSGLKGLTGSNDFRQALLRFKTGETGQMNFSPQPFGLDFLEILDSNYRVIATWHRPGLLTERILPVTDPTDSVPTIFMERLEYDLNGPHPAYSYIRKLEKNLYLNTGRYIDTITIRQLGRLIEAEITLQVEPNVDNIYRTMTRDELYKIDNRYWAVLAGGAASDFYLTAEFKISDSTPMFVSLLKTTALVALLSAIIAVVLGLYITGRAKREIDNLVAATGRVAAGDFNTPVMAYEEGEFAQLADSFTEMTVKLKAARATLATTEKIAAWQIIGRKIAHEIKNPLTPIALSTDDLHRSYFEKLPDFEITLKETTAIIKNEVSRMSRLLDEFVSFARMKTPELKYIDSSKLIADISTLYKQPLENGQLQIMSGLKNTKVKIDPDLFQQVLINLIKNGLEAAAESNVAIAFEDVADGWMVTVEDTGPGFPESKLSDSFEPFVTTKKDGSGLGLVICHRIVHDHGGTMTLYNQKEGGAGVKITMPR
ncbi:MAG: sensor histidine kinase [Candidatus Zixiibacteriota bacterium]